MSDQSQLSTKAPLLGFYAAILTVIITLITFTIAYLTPPLSGPYCQGSCFAYPYLDTASRFPRDYIWMYPAMALMVLFVALMASIHQYAQQDKKAYGLTGLIFASISATLFITDYFLQLSVMQPSLMAGETDGLSLLTQFNPHGVFIAIEELGYLLMGLSFAFMAPLFSGGKLRTSIRWTFITSFILTILSLAFYSFQYGAQREYRFEVAAISINWLTLIVAGILLSLLFKRKAGAPEIKP